LADEVAEENLPLAMMYAVVKQAEMIASLAKRKTPNKDDVKTALTCFGKREENKPGFAR
jgi:histone H3/H4